MLLPIREVSFVYLVEPEYFDSPLLVYVEITVNRAKQGVGEKKNLRTKQQTGLNLSRNVEHTRVTHICVVFPYDLNMS